MYAINTVSLWQDFNDRDAKRAAAALNPKWKEFLELSRPHVQYQVGSDTLIILDSKAAIESMLEP